MTAQDDHKRTVSEELSRSDIELVRALEDLIYVLIDKGVISITDLPEPVRNKLAERQELRGRLAGIIGSEEEDADEDLLP